MYTLLKLARSTVGIAVLGVMILQPVPPIAGAQDSAAGATRNEAWIASVLDSFPAQVRQPIEQAVSRASREGASRRDSLARTSCALSVYGHDDAAAVACALFLREFAPTDSASASMAQRLAESLAPLGLSESAMEFTENGPVFRPQWGRSGRPTDRRLRQAVLAYEYVASLANNDHAKAEALAMTGWVSRALGDWDGAIACWERCATECPGTNAARNAFWYAAEDLQNTDRAAAAAEQLRRFIQQYPDEVRVPTARKRIHLLEAESRRTDTYTRNPVSSLAKEVEVAGGAIAPWEAYVDGMRWLERRGHGFAGLHLARWAAGQTDWPHRAKVGACLDAVSLLLTRGGGAAAARTEAIAVLHGALEPGIGPEAAPLALQMADLLCQQDQFDAAAAALERLSRTQDDPIEWRALMDAELIRVTALRGDRERARRLLATFAERNPDRTEVAQLRAVVEGY